MKICFYNLTAGFKTGGLETYCWEVGKALVRQGHEVHIIGGEGGERRNNEVKLIALPYRPRNTFPNLGTRFRKLMERLSFAEVALPHLLAGNYDAVVVNKPYDFPTLWRARRAGMTAVTAIRSGGTEFYFSDRFFSQAVDCWISTSFYNAKQVEVRYRHPVTVIPNGVDPDLFSPASKSAAVRTKFCIPAQSGLIVSVGRLVGWKGFQVIIETLPALPDAHYLIVGEGESRLQLEELARAKGVKSRVHFAGEIRHSDLPSILASCDIFAQPSIGEEAFGISVVEAMACSLPVLASDQGGLKEIVSPGVTGFLIPPGSEEWQQRLSALLVDRKQRTSMGEVGRSKVLEGFTWARNAEKLSAFLMSKESRLYK